MIYMSRSVKKQVLRQYHWSEMSHPFKKLGQTDHPTDQKTNRQTDRPGHRAVSLPKRRRRIEIESENWPLMVPKRPLATQPPAPPPTAHKRIIIFMIDSSYESIFLLSIERVVVYVLSPAEFSKIMACSKFIKIISYTLQTSKRSCDFSAAPNISLMFFLTDSTIDF